jgi:hypothetical protein
MDGVISGDLLDRFSATDRLHGDSGLLFGTVGAALANWWDHRSGAVLGLPESEFRCRFRRAVRLPTRAFP